MFESVRVSGRNPACLILGRFKNASLDKATADVAAKVDPDGAIKAALKRAEFKGDAGQVAEVFIDGVKDRVLIVGLGEKKSLSADTLRNVAAAAGRKLAAGNCTSASIDLAGPVKAAKLDAADAGCAFGEGLGLLSWTCDEFRGSATDLPNRQKLTITSPLSAFAKGLERGLGLAEGANLARTLSQTPPNIATCEFIESECKKLARKTGMKCTVIKGKKLEDENLQGLINVGKAAEHGPRLIRLEYTPSRGKSAKPAVLVGKTMTYDTGGLSIKPSASMAGMKRDKDGGCAVFGAMHNIATVIKPNRRVVALLSVAENSISDEAYRPDDVITFRNGVSVEVTNTDAEGRLVLADALIWACENEDPAYIVDMATLTGGVVVALGSVYAGVWCDDEKLLKSAVEAGDATGERVWRLPHHADYRSMMKSPVADILNSAPVREAHPIQGAAFLSYFVEDGTPWCHIDIAGTHATTKSKGPIDPGPTGFGARLAAEIVERH